MRNLLLDTTRFADVQESAFFDTCTINTYSETSDSLGDLIKSFSAGSPISCSVTPTGGNKQYKDTFIQSENDLIILTPLETSVNNQDTITVTNKMGTNCSDTYSIQSIEMGIGIKIIKIKKLMV